ncbi:MAG: DUF4838 domain-containing protein [Oscillospiraceae bacterium]|nr:DUF4838 domain-containing protein [Oscillospiraceae bacterium]
MKTKLLVNTDDILCGWVERMHKNGVDIVGIHPEGGKQAHHSLDHLLRMLKLPKYRDKLNQAAHFGMEVEYGIHAASWLLPRDLFAEHPEYFRMNEEGERTPELNFCVSNEEALAVCAENAAKLAKALYGSSRRYFFWMDDAKDAYCHCEKCRKLSPSDQQLTVLNAMIRRLRQDDPEASLAYLAYINTLTPPETVKPEEGIFLEYAPYERDMQKPVSEMPEAEIRNIEALLDFFGRENSVVLEYWYDNSLFSRYKKPPKLLTVDNERILRDVRFYREMGFGDISSFACFLGLDYLALYGEPDLSAVRSF